MASEADALRAYFNQRSDDLTAATKVAVQRAGRAYAREANRQLKKNFSGRAGRAKAKFYKARQTLPDASIVSIKPAFLQIFEEGATVRGQKFLVIPVAPFRRVGGRGWGATYRMLERRGQVAIIPTDLGYLVTLNKRPAYNLIKEANIPKKLNLREYAREQGDKMASVIENLLND